MAPNNLTVQIQNLEKQLGIKLFDREKRPIRLTQAGSAFLEDARSILATLEQAEHKVQRVYPILENILRQYQKHHSSKHNANLKSDSHLPVPNEHLIT